MIRFLTSVLALLIFVGSACAFDPLPPPVANAPERLTTDSGAVIEKRGSVWVYVSEPKVTPGVVTSRPFVPSGVGMSGHGPPIITAPTVEPINRGFLPAAPTYRVTPIGVRSVGRGGTTNCPT